jgi:hypothetical protein
MKTKINIIKNMVASIILAGALLLPSTKTRAESVNLKDYELTKRVLEADFVHPFATAEARANATYSANQVVDYLLNKSENDSLILRVGKTAVDVWGKNFTAYISHEAGHERDDLRFGSGIRWRSLTPQIAPSERALDTLDEKLQYCSAGINQNTYNSNIIWENGQRFGNFDNTGFLFNSLYGAFYSPDSSTRDGINCTNDLEDYCDALAEKGIHETPENLKRKSLITNALTLQNWASVWKSVNYTLNRQTNNEPLTFKIRDTEITPPIFSHYLTGEGTYFQGDVLVNPRGQIPIKVSGGFSDERVRGGVKLYGLRLTDKFSLNPFAHVDNHGGHNFGTDVNYTLTQNVGLTARVEQNNRDILENDVKNEGNGVNFKLGIIGRF